MEALASRHNLPLLGKTPWKKGVMGGSDDHSGLNIARTYTRCDGADDLKSAFAAVSANKAKVEILAPTPLTMAHNLYGIAYQYYHSRFDPGRHRGKDVLMTFLDRSLNPRYKAENRWVSRLYFFWGNRRKNRPKVEGISNTLLGLLHQETRKLILETGGLYALLSPYFISFSQFTKDTDMDLKLRRRFAPEASGGK